MTTPRFVIEDNVEDFNGDLLVFCVYQAKEGGLCHGPMEKQVQKAVEVGDFSGKEEETLLFYPLHGMELSLAGVKRVLVLGLGDPSEQEEPGGVRDLFRRTGGVIAKQCEKLKAQTLMVTLPETELLEPGQMAECLVEGICLGDYRFVKYKKEKSKEREYPGLNHVALAPGKTDHDVLQRGMDLGRTAAMAVCQARDMANEPGNAWTATAFAEFAQNFVEDLVKDSTEPHSLGCRILEKSDMERLGMGGILAVNRGSDEPPQMVVVEYLPEKRAETILLVGKGVTFDSGGISLKTALGMENMKYDMCGGAAVLCAMQVVALERPNVGVVAIIPATDNLAGGMAVKPGDIIRHFNGITSEIINTDAEGRVILADALAWGINEYSPCCVVDIATLTGAVVMGLGHHYSGLMGNNDLLAQRLVSAGARSGEPLWRLPLGKAYSKQIESKVADIRNIGGKSAGAITAAAYLENFVGDTPWAHLDIAGTAWDFTEKTYIPKGPSGVGVRTLVELIRSWEPGVCG
jgi:leucyl aminopeptidase